MQLAALEIDIAPAQAAQLGGAQPGEDRGQQQRPEARGFVDVASAAMMARISSGDGMSTPILSLPLPSARPRAAVLAQRVDDVLRHEAALLRVGEDAAERAAGIAHHGRRAPVPAQPILEAAHQRARSIARA